MKRNMVIFLVLACLSNLAYSQQVTSSRLWGTWDQVNGKNPATIIFVDSSRVRYSYKGHTGTTKDYYYLINNTNNPAILTVDYSQNHKKHRNEYLIQFISRDTIKMQVLYKKDSRDHFKDEPSDQIVKLSLRKFL
jgi:hypothetical protein